MRYRMTGRSRGLAIFRSWWLRKPSPYSSYQRAQHIPMTRLKVPSSLNISPNAVILQTVLTLLGWRVVEDYHGEISGDFWDCSMSLTVD